MKAIGGYFELDIPLRNEFYHDALKFQSARAAFLALLRTGNPRRVWVPSYICDAMLAPLYKAGIDCTFYSINDRLEIPYQLELADGDWLLYVNYFGICSQHIDTLLERYNPKQIVLDQSQAFFSPPRDCLATIYSPRKFFGVPDGGLLFSQLDVPIPEEVDHCSIDRMSHMLIRLAESPEAGYAAYLKSEASLQNLQPRQMSRLTRRLLLGQDYEFVLEKRTNNFMFLHDQLGKLNLLHIDDSNINAPLCYPFVMKRSGLRQRLIAERVFIPTYWPDVLKRVCSGSWEHQIVDLCLPLPCDQRYESSDCDRIVSTILADFTD